MLPAATTVMLAGSGVGHFDRRFIRAQMPRLDARLHYATLDIGAVRRFLTLTHPAAVRRIEADLGPIVHRAAADVRRSHAEAVLYQSLLTP